MALLLEHYEKILIRFAVLGGAALLFLIIIAPITAIMCSSWVLAFSLVVSLFLSSALSLYICEKGIYSVLIYVLMPAAVSVILSALFKFFIAFKPEIIIMLLCFAVSMLLAFCVKKIFKIIKSSEELPCLQ